MRNRLSFILVIVWIFTGFLCLGIGVREFILRTENNYLIFFIMAIVAFGFAWFRYKQRRKDS